MSEDIPMIAPFNIEKIREANASTRAILEQAIAHGLLDPDIARNSLVTAENYTDFRSFVQALASEIVMIHKAVGFHPISLTFYIRALREIKGAAALCGEMIDKSPLLDYLAYDEESQTVMIRNTPYHMSVIKSIAKGAF